MEQEIDGQEVIETPETGTESQEIEETESTESTDERDTRIADLEKKALELEEKNKKLYARLKKGDEKAPSSLDSSLSNKDILALAKSTVSDEDIDEVIDFAKFRKISVAEALQNKTMKTILGEREEERKTASATHVKGGARSASKTSGADILAKAERTGEVPDSEEGLKALFQARLARKLGRK